MIDVQVMGTGQLVAKLDRLAEKDAKAAIRKGTRAGAKVVQKTAVGLAPVRSGALKRSIKVRGKRSKNWIGTACRLVNDKNIHYGSFVDLGTKSIEGRRFMKAAADQSGQQALDASLSEIANQIIERAKA